MELKKLPLGVQDFLKIRTGNFLYVDKTRYLYQLAHIPQAFYFLSRPRRFGKSLTLSALQYLFAGRQELFTGLWIAQTDWNWITHPVIKIDFNQLSHETPDTLRHDLLSLLDHFIDEHQLALGMDSLPMKFAGIITALEKKYRQPVVVLIDEYDKPIISHLGRGAAELQIAINNRDVLKQFFGVLKAQDVAAALRFVFLTGVSKFSRVSIFSDLNNLNDITMLGEYAGFLGYTAEELAQNFTPYIRELAEKRGITPPDCLEQLRLWYNGYQFTDETMRVYNPFSILSVLQNKKFRNYWFETGTPSFLVNLIKERNYQIPLIEQLEIRENAFTKYELEDLSLEALLFQSGYITIHSYANGLYKLNYPNQEVKKSFTDYLYERLVRIPDTTVKNKFIALAGLLEADQLAEFIRTVNIILSSIPYTQLTGKDEAFYHTVFYLMLTASGSEVLTEVLTSRGRLDLAVFLKLKIYIIELKCNRSAALALSQIKEKGYAEKYLGSGRGIRLLGINFDTRLRKVTEWLCEDLPKQAGSAD